MADITKLKEANLVTVGAVLAAPTKARLVLVAHIGVDAKTLQ